MSEEYKKKEKDYEQGIRAALKDVVGNPDEVLANRTLFGMSLDTLDVEKLRFYLAYMIIYKDMR